MGQNMYLDTETRAYNGSMAKVRSINGSATVHALHTYHSDSWGWALACCKWHEARAQDTLQEAYLRVLDGRATFGEQAALRTWFFGVIRNVALEMNRQQFQGQLSTESPHTEAATELDPQEQLDDDQTASALRVALQLLSQRQREVLHLVFYGHLTLEETATTLDISVGSARQHYHRGKQQLVKLLELE